MAGKLLELTLAEIAAAGAWFCPTMALPGGLRWGGSGPVPARAVADLVIATDGESYRLRDARSHRKEHPTTHNT